jgi:hypothetical protein
MKSKNELNEFWEWYLRTQNKIDRKFKIKRFLELHEKEVSSKKEKLLFRTS